MKPLIILIAVFGLGCLITLAFQNHVNWQLSGLIAMAAMLIFTSIAHFMFWKGIQLMLPQNLPYKKAIVYLTGIIEILAAIGLLIPHTVQITGVLLIIFFILITPSNIKAAKQHVNLEKADYTGYGISYLWFRIPLQLFFISWIYFFSIYSNRY